jgi:phospholipid/cholesterol/gamma-HCH transport system substrate-binding protein
MSKEAKLGLFVIVVIAVFLFFTVNMGALFFKKGAHTHKIYFGSIGTLEDGAPVKQAGFDVGVVESIALETIHEPTKTTYIVVEIRVSDEAQVAIDSKATIQTMGMMGEKYIELTFGMSPVSATKETRIQGQGPAELDKVIERAIDLSNDVQITVQSFNRIIGDPQLQENIVVFINNLEQFSERLNNVLGGERERLTNIMANAEAASGDLRRMLATAELLITDVRSVINDNKIDLHRTISNTADLTEKLKTDVVGNVQLAVGNINDTVIDLREFVSDLRSFSDKLNGTVDNANSIVNRVGDIVDENRPDMKDSLSNLKRLTESANRASTKIENLLHAIDENEGLVHKLIYDEEMGTTTHKTIQEAEEVLSTFTTFPERLSLYTEFRAFSDRPRFAPDDDFFRADMGIQYDFTDQMRVYIGSNNLGSSNDIEAQVYYQLGRFILHGGVIESEVGLGIDWEIYKRWLIGMEAIGLTDRGKDRLNIYTDINVWKDIYLTGGIEDIGNKRYPNAGLKFKF